MKIELEGLTIEKGKYTPFENKIPTLAQWKRTGAGQDHCKVYRNKKNGESDRFERTMVKMTP